MIISMHAYKVWHPMQGGGTDIVTNTCTLMKLGQTSSVLSSTPFLGKGVAALPIACAIYIPTDAQ